MEFAKLTGGGTCILCSTRFSISPNAKVTQRVAARDDVVDIVRVRKVGTRLDAGTKKDEIGMLTKDSMYASSKVVSHFACLYT